ncbi:MAG: retroviral-like aspartic protease family protein [Alphaproteobacteria bacterium]|nr:retroviral-like aspartic protease family protein [Alphaproteobacteria bacterium]
MRGAAAWAPAIRAASLGLLLAQAGCADPSGGCRVSLAATYPVAEPRGVITVPVEIDRATVAMVVDTGARRSVLASGAASRLGLVGSPWLGTLLAGVGGSGPVHRDALISRLAFADYATGPGSLAIGDMDPVPGSGPAAEGLLGEDVLHRFDLEFDLPHGQLRLYRVAGCGGRFLPWRTPYAAVPARLSWRRANLIVPVMLNGQPMQAVLDTGATGVIVGADAARRAGVTPAMLAADRPMKGRAAIGAGFTLVRHRFDALTVGPVQTGPTELFVLGRALDEGDMLLGLAWLRRQPVWISYATGQVFVALPHAGAAP